MTTDAGRLGDDLFAAAFSRPMHLGPAEAIAGPAGEVEAMSGPAAAVAPARHGAAARRRAARREGGATASVRRRVDRPAARPGDRRHALCLYPLQRLPVDPRDRARPPAGAGARRRRERRPADRRHQPRARRSSATTTWRRACVAAARDLGPAEGAQRRHPGRALDGRARYRRHGSRRAASTTLLGRDFSDRDYFRGPRESRDGSTLHVAAPYKTSLGTYSVVFSRAITGAERRLRGRGHRRARARVLRGPDALGPVCARHVGLARPQRRQGVRDDAARHPPGRHRLAARCRPPRAGAERRAAAPVVLGAVGGSERDADDCAAQPLAAGAAHGQAAGHRRQPGDSRGAAAVAPAGARVRGVLRPAERAAAIGLYRGQWRRKAFARLEASAARERQRSAEQLELALQGADLGLWDWDLRDDTFVQNEVTRRSSATLRARSARTAEPGAPYIHPDDIERNAARPRGALPARDRGLRMRVPGPPQVRPLGLAAEPRQGRRARRVRHAGTDGRAPTWT